MIVNIHNYETYFLLYVDNELTANEIAAVELFVQQNPFYQNELSLLQKAKLNEETILFEDKLSLYQISELDTQCLAYLDNEMSANEIKKFELALQGNPSLVISLANWRNSKSPIDDGLTLNPAFKNTLYKKEANLKPLWGWYAKYGMGSVAAILMLFLGYRIANVSGKEAASIVLTKTSSSKMPITKTMSKEKVVNLLHASVAQNHKNWTPPTITVVASKSIPFNELVENTVEPNAEIPKTALTETILTTTNEIVIENKQPIETMAVPIAYKEMDIEQEEEGRILYIGNLEVDGTKFREVRRKITALFKRNELEKLK